MADSPKLIDKSCPVRPCVIERQLDNCSQCNDYVCGKLKERLVVYEDVRKRIAAEIPDDDYVRFIKPYENKRRLEKMRNSSKG
jgi:hypothetical protein